MTVTALGPLAFGTHEHTAQPHSQLIFPTLANTKMPHSMKGSLLQYTRAVVLLRPILCDLLLLETLPNLALSGLSPRPQPVSHLSSVLPTLLDQLEADHSHDLLQTSNGEVSRVDDAR